MLALFAALDDEIKLIRSEMECDKIIRVRPFTIFIGKYHNRRLVLVRTGVGKAQMAASLSYFLTHEKPSFIINTGYAGGLSPSLHAGDIVISNAVIDEATEEIFTPSADLIGLAERAAEATGIRVQKGRTVTVDRPVSDPHQKAFVGSRFEAIACDMESSVFAKMAHQKNIPFLVVRSILDPLDTPLPDFAGDVVSGDTINIGKLLSHVTSHPKDLMKLPRLSYLSSQARLSLTNFVREWVKNDVASGSEVV